MVAENATSSARLLSALLARGFDLPAAVRELNLPAAELLALARDDEFRAHLHDLRSLMVALAHLHALSTLQRLSSPDPETPADPIEQRRACSAILRFRAHPHNSPPSAQCPVPGASSSAQCPLPSASPAPTLPCSDTAEYFMQDLVGLLEPEPGPEDDLEDPDTLDHPDSPTGNALRSLHACLLAHGPGHSLDGREAPLDPADFLRWLDPDQIRELTGFVAPIRYVDVDTDTQHVERLVMPKRGGGECNFRRFTLIRAGPDLPWRLQSVAPYDTGPGHRSRW